MKALVWVALIACVLAVGCTPSASQGDASSGPPAVTEGTREPSRSEDSTATLKGWFAPGLSARLATTSTEGPEDAIGYFSVTRTGDDPAIVDVATMTRVYVSPDTRNDLGADPLDARACTGTWIWIDYRRDGEDLIAERVWGPVGIAY